MRLSGAKLASGLTMVGLLGAYWFVGAQEVRSLWEAPPALPPDASSGPAIPGVSRAPENKTGIQQVGAPPPLLPIPQVNAPPLSQPPPPAFPGGVNPTVPEIPPVSAPDPGKVLVTDPLPKDAAKTEPVNKSLPPPQRSSPPLEAPPPVVVPEEKKDPIVMAPQVSGPTEKMFVRFNAGRNQQTISPPTTPGPTLPLPLDVGLAARPAIQDRPPLIQVQTPLITVEKRGVPLLLSNETQPYTILVRNQGSFPAERVRIEEPLPSGAHVVSAEPPAELRGSSAVWTLTAVAPGSEQVLRLTVQGGPSKTGEAMKDYVTGVRVYAGGSAPGALPLAPQSAEVTSAVKTVSLRTPNPADPIAIRLLGPNRAVVGRTAIFEIRITNQSQQAMSGMILYGILPEGLTTPRGPEIECDVTGILRPGETKSINMPTTAVKAGRYTVEAKIVTKDRFEISGQTTVEIGTDTMQVLQTPGARLFAGREGDCKIELANPTNETLRNVTVVSQLAEGLEFVSASDSGLYQANSRNVYWILDRLAPGQERSLTLRLGAVAAGQHQHAVSVRADNLAETRSIGVIAVDGFSDLSLKVITRDNPLEVNRETVYEVQVANPGQASTTNVRLQVEFPPGMTPRQAQADVKYSVDRQSVVFEPLAVLGPQGQAIFRISAVAQTPGNDQRVRFSVTSDQMRTPLTKEISILVYP